MFRWPLALTPLSLGSSGASRDTTLEITPRGAIFTLAALAHVGHPAHVATIDAYIKGHMRISPQTGLGEDSRLVLSALAGPLVAAHELGIPELSLADLVLLPPATTPVNDGLTRSSDSPRFLLRSPDAPDRWHWVRTAERFESAGCLGTPHPGLGTRWHDLIVRAPARPYATETSISRDGLAAIEAELRTPTHQTAPPVDLVAALRGVALDRFGRNSQGIGDSISASLTALAANGGAPSAQVAAYRADSASPNVAPAGNGADGQSQSLPLVADDLLRERAAYRATGVQLGTLDLVGLARALPDLCARRSAGVATLNIGDVMLTMSLAPDFDGYQTLCLLPRAASDAPPLTFAAIRQATWDTIEAIMGRPLAEYRTEPIALRLVAADGPATVLNIGVSVVIVRNQTVFTGWIGSDGRVMLKLFPPGGMGTGA